MQQHWRQGNAAEDSRETRGWLLGHFIDQSEGLRSTRDVEVKWGVHPAGDKRSDWATDTRNSFVLLVAGQFIVHFRGGSATLATQGDYVLYGQGIDHSWEAVSDSIVLTVRWPSLPS